jgi:hypothetical protein
LLDPSYRTCGDTRYRGTCTCALSDDDMGSVQLATMSIQHEITRFSLRILSRMLERGREEGEEDVAISQPCWPIHIIVFGRWLLPESIQAEILEARWVALRIAVNGIAPDCEEA